MSRGIAGGNAVTRDVWPWGGAPRAKREQSSPEEREGNVELRPVRQRHTVCNAPSLVPNTDQVIPVPLLQVGQIVAGFVIPVSQQDHLPGNAGAVCHLAQGSALVLFVLLLHDQVGINAVFQVKERVHVPEVPAVLPGRAGAVGGRVLWVGGGFQR